MKLILGIAVSTLLVGCGIKVDVETELKNLEKKIAVEYINAGSMAARAGDYMTSCVNFGLAKQAVLQIGDEPTYKIILEAEKKACKAAGI